MLFEPADARALESRTRMISFRLTTEEYARFRDLCLARGLRNVSEVVRLAVNQLLANNSELPEITLQSRIALLESRMTAVESRLNPEFQPSQRHLRSRAAASGQA